jgi:hypothetical protein
MSFKYFFYAVCVTTPIVLAGGVLMSEQQKPVVQERVSPAPIEQAPTKKDNRSPRNKREDELRKKAGDNLFSGKCYLSQPTATGLRRGVPENCIVYYSEDFVALQVFGESAFWVTDDVFVVYEKGKGGEFWRNDQTPEVYDSDSARLEESTITLRGSYSIDISFGQ